MSEEDADHLDEKTNAEFVASMMEDIQSGEGIVPFIGSGCSSQSGILMGEQFEEYLAYTVFLCTAKENDLIKADKARFRKWDLRKNGWPQQPTPLQFQVARRWLSSEFKEICERYYDYEIKVDSKSGKIVTSNRTQKIQSIHSLTQAIRRPVIPRILRQVRPNTITDSKNCNDKSQSEENAAIKSLLNLVGSHQLEQGKYTQPGLSPSSAEAIRERAIRSLFDWRSTLAFLSELKLVDDERLLIDIPDPVIIDRFNIHITGNRKPNLIHNMLCHLSGPARLRTILTTNFDTLIEDAFTEIEEKISVISVSIKGDLPDPEIVHSRNTIIKMHGTAWETRADFSLNDSPSLKSKHTFYHYIRGEYPDNQEVPSYLPRNLLVCGYSGSDNRCLELIKYVLDASRTAKVYWICHSKSAFKKLSKIFPEETYSHQLYVTISERCDLLLYELYQKLCLSLPRGGFNYQYTHNVAPGIPEIPSDKKESIKLVNRLVKYLEKASEKRSECPRKLICVTGKSGVLGVLRQAIRSLTEKNLTHQVWLELEDYQNTYCVAYEILIIVSIRLGLFQLGHATLVPISLINKCENILESSSSYNEASDEMANLWHEHLELLVANYFRIVPGKWTIVLYGRNGPGGCSGWTETGYWKEIEYGSKSKSGRFAPFVKALCQIGFNVVYAPYDLTRQAGDKRKIDHLIQLIADPKNQAHSSPEYELPPTTPESEILWNFNLSRDFGGIELFSLESQESGAFEACALKIKEDWLDSQSAWFMKDLHENEEKWRSALTYLRFLYSSTLFRHSRHYSAFLNEGVLRCPNRFNTTAVDNDWHRAQTVEACLKKLQNINLFHTKLGGFAWAYRDCRLGLRLLIESNPAFQNEIESMRTWRSYYHYWIGDWYIKAFYTTGHAIPLMEAIFHFFQVIVHLDCYRNERNTSPPETRGIERSNLERAQRRYRLWRMAAGDITKALRTGRGEIRLWFARPEFMAWFSADEVMKVMETRLEFAVEPLGPEKDKATKYGKTILASCRQEFDQLKQYGEDTPRIKKSNSYFVGTSDHWTDDSQDDEEETGSKFSKVENRPDFWHAAPFGINDLCDMVPLYIGGDGLSHRVRDWQREKLINLSQTHIFYLVQQLNQWAFVFVQRASFSQISGMSIDEVDADSPPMGLGTQVKQLWVTVTILANCAIECCRLTHPNLNEFDKKERVRALCLYGLGLARMGRFYEAHRRLNEANAILSKVEVRNPSVLMGIIELRRAETHLLESMFLAEISLMVRMKKWKQGIDESHIRTRYGLDHCKNDELREKQCGRLLKLMIAKIDDAWNSLENAGNLLAGKHQSPRWWGYLCLLKLKCLAEIPANPDQSSKKKLFARLVAQRKPSEPFDLIHELFSEGFVCVLDNTRIKLLLIDFALQALRRIGASDSQLLTYKELLFTPCKKFLEDQYECYGQSERGLFARHLRTEIDKC